MTLAGIVERVGAEDYPELLLRLDQPAPGIAHLFPMPMGGQVILSLRFYLYGPQAFAVVAKVDPEWQTWIMQYFPPAAGTNWNC